MLMSVHVGLVWPGPFRKIDAAIRKDRAFASVDQSYAFVVFAERRIEFDFRSGRPLLDSEFQIECGCLGVVHFIMRVKRDVTEPILYGAVLAFLLVVRILDYSQRRRRKLRGKQQA